MRRLEVDLGRHFHQHLFDVERAVENHHVRLLDGSERPVVHAQRRRAIGRPHGDVIELELLG
jgi:hypothetical protein